MDWIATYSKLVNQSICEIPLVSVETSTPMTSYGNKMSLRECSLKKSIEEYCKIVSANACEMLNDIVDEVIINNAECDKYDYAMAAFSGVFTGLVDSFFVGSPLSSPLGKVTDKYIDDLVVRFARWTYDLERTVNAHKSSKQIRRRRPDSIASAIGFLENRFQVNYDARYASDLLGSKTLTNFSPKNHHLKSLAHCPDVVGLFFAILDQLTGKTSIVCNGKLVRLPSVVNRGKLQGDSLIENIAYGFINWFGHLMSDVAGSSGTRGHIGKRGMGIPIPGFELMQFAQINPEAEVQGLEMLVSHMFQNGYDFRFGVAMSVPVLINDVLIKILWVLRQRYCFGMEWKDVFMSMSKSYSLSRMRLVSTGCFLLVDLGDAAIRSEGQLLVFAMHLNYVGICKFAHAGYHEITLYAKCVGENMVNSFYEIIGGV